MSVRFLSVVVDLFEKYSNAVWGYFEERCFRKWDEGLFDGKRTPYIIVFGLVYVGGKYWFVVLLHKKCFQWKPCAKAAGNQSRVSWHLQHMSVYVYLYMSIYRVLSLHFECVILICTRLWPFWLNLKPAGHLVCNSMPSAPGGNGVVAAAPATAKQSPPVLRLDLQDQTFSIVTTTPHFLSRGIPPSGAVPAPDNMSQSVSYGSFASREAIVYQDVMFCSSIIVCTWLSKSALDILEVYN